MFWKIMPLHHFDKIVIGESSDSFLDNVRKLLDFKDAESINVNDFRLEQLPNITHFTLPKSIFEGSSSYTEEKVWTYLWPDAALAGFP